MYIAHMIYEALRQKFSYVFHFEHVKKVKILGAKVFYICRL